MKTAAHTVLIFLSVLFFSCSNSGNDSVREAHEKNINSAIDEDISEFMTEAADARMMNIEQGKLAMERGTSAAVKQYGEWMVNDQTKLLQDLRMLAASKNITLPATISNKKAKGLENLKKKEGEAFDEQFIEMMRNDHRRDVRDFDDATDFRDKDVQKFATTYLPVIQSHLDKIRHLEAGESGNVTESASTRE